MQGWSWRWRSTDVWQCLDKLSQLTINIPLVRACSGIQLYLTLCDPTDCSPPGSSVHVILQARILGWVAISSSREGRPLLPDPGVEPTSLVSPALAGRFFTPKQLGKLINIPLDSEVVITF